MSTIRKRFIRRTLMDSRLTVSNEIINKIDEKLSKKYLHEIMEEDIEEQYHIIKKLKGEK